MSFSLLVYAPCTLLAGFCFWSFRMSSYWFCYVLFYCYVFDGTAGVVTRWPLLPTPSDPEGLLGRKGAGRAGGLRSKHWAADSSRSNLKQLVTTFEYDEPQLAMVSRKSTTEPSIHGVIQRSLALICRTWICLGMEHHREGEPSTIQAAEFVYNGRSIWINQSVYLSWGFLDWIQY